MKKTLIIITLSLYITQSTHPDTSDTSWWKRTSKNIGRKVGNAYDIAQKLGAIDMDGNIINEDLYTQIQNLSRTQRITVNKNFDNAVQIILDSQSSGAGSDAIDMKLQVDTAKVLIRRNIKNKKIRLEDLINASLSSEEKIAKKLGISVDALEELDEAQLANINSNVNSTIIEITDNTGISELNAKDGIGLVSPEILYTPSDTPYTKIDFIKKIIVPKVINEMDLISKATIKNIKDQFYGENGSSHSYISTDAMSDAMSIAKYNATLQDIDPVTYVAETYGDVLFATTPISTGKGAPIATMFSPEEVSNILSKLKINKADFLTKYTEYRTKTINRIYEGNSDAANTAIHKMLNELQENNFITPEENDSLIGDLPKGTISDSTNNLKSLTAEAHATVTDARRVDIPQTELIKYGSELQSLDVQGTKLTFSLDELANTSENPLFEMINSSDALKDATDPVTFESEGNEYRYDPPSEESPGSLEMIPGE